MAVFGFSYRIPYEVVRSVFWPLLCVLVSPKYKRGRKAQISLRLKDQPAFRIRSIWALVRRSNATPHAPEYAQRGRHVPAE